MLVEIKLSILAGNMPKVSVVGIRMFWNCIAHQRFPAKAYAIENK
jgi:hypothetical protein